MNFKFTATDLFAVTRLELQKDGGVPMPLELKSGEAVYAISTKPQDNGVHTLKLTAWDENGNVAELEVTYTVDNYSWTPAIWGVFVGVGVMMLFLLMILTKPKPQAANRKKGGA